VRPFPTLACLVLAACAPKAGTSDAEQLARGERAYRKCYSCHALEPGRNDLQGPTLHRIVGRSIAAEQGFAYSPAMLGFAGREQWWGKGLLDKFIADPEGLVPGTSMTFHGISDADERKALIEYLERQTSASAANLP
jgi:cytochrome c2